MQLSYSQKVIFNDASIRHFEFANLSIFFHVSVAWGKICVCILNFVKFGQFCG